MKLRPTRSRKRGRIEIIPMIDVMFFLLATFMLASLAMQNLHSLAVDLPKGSGPSLQPTRPITLTVTRAGAILVNETAVTLETLAPALQAMLPGPETHVIVNADNLAPNGTVVQAMLRAREAGATRFVFAIKRE